MSLEESREEINEANKKIVEDVRKRMDAVLKVADIKERKGRNIRDKEREEEVKQQFEELFKSKKLPGDRGREMADILIETAVDVQKEVLRK